MKHLFFPCILSVVSSLSCLSPAADVSTKPLILKQGGTPEKPVVFDGKGMIIDLGTDVTDHAWEKTGDVWTSMTPLSGSKPVADGQSSALFVDEMPLPLARDSEAERALRGKKVKGFRFLPPDKLKPGQVGFTAEGILYFRWPAGKMPGQSHIVIPSKPALSGVTIACSQIIVKNITAMHAANDGFNIHGSWVGIRLENIRAISNCDEGISAHDDVQMEVDKAEIAWNGSSDGGVAEVGSSKTHYTNCTVHDNLGAAFKFFGVEHSVKDTVIYHQTKDFYLRDGTKFAQERIKRR